MNPGWTRQAFSRCPTGREAVPFRIMRAWLISGLWLLACSSGVDHSTSPAAPAGSGGMPTAGVAATQAGGASADQQAVSGGSSGLNGGGSAGVVVIGGTTQSGTGGVSTAGAGGLSVGGSTGGSAGAVAQAGAGGSGGLSAIGGSTAIGGEGGDSPGGASGAGGDGGAPADCVCAAGPCCDGCHFLPPSHFCGEVVRSVRCFSGGTQEGDYWNLFCNGDATTCTRWAVHTKYAAGVCASGVVCVGGADTSCN